MQLTPVTIFAWLLLYTLLALLPMGLAMGIERPPPRELLVEIGAMLGLLGLGMLATQLVISGRQRWFARGLGQDKLLQFHRRTGTFAWVLLLCHPALLMIGDPAFLAWLDPRQGLLRAVTLAGLLLALSALLISSLWREPLGLQYEHWRALHAILALLVVAGGLGHALMGAHHTDGIATQLTIGLVVIVPLLLLLETRLWRPWRLRRYPWRVTEVEARRADSTRLVLEADGHPGLTFKPGQFAWLTIGDTPFSLQQHPFSMSSSPSRSTRLEFVIKEAGDFTASVAAIKPGQRAFLEGPYGVFTMPEDERRRAVFIAGGIGITPILSMLRARCEHNDKKPAWLIYANESEDEIVMRELIDELASELPLTVVHVLDKPSAEWSGETGFINSDLLARHLPDDGEDIDYFVCGPPPMMDKVEPALKARGVDTTRLYSEHFNLV